MSFFYYEKKILNLNQIYMKDMKDFWSGVLTICMEKPEILVGKPNGLCHSFLKASWSEAMKFFLLFSVCSADLDILCGGLFSHQVKFYSFMFMQKISTQVVCVNAKSSRFLRVN